MKKKYFIIIAFFISLNSYTQITLNSTTNGIVSVTYNDAANGWALYNPLSDTEIYLYIWVDNGMNSLGNYYQDEWNNSGSLVTLTWDGSNWVGTIDLNTHNFTNSGNIIPTGITVLDFNFILRSFDGTNQSGNLLASDYGFANSTLPVEEFIKDSISINLIDNKIQIEGLQYNQKFVLDIYDLNGRLVKKMNEKSSLNLNELSPAIYVLKFKTEDNIVKRKKVIKK